jgi:hypothetical protein
MSSARFVLELSRAVVPGRNGFVAVLKAYMDETGTHDGSPVVAVGAYIAKPTVWAKWTKDWNAAKRRVPVGHKPINVFHAVDCANREEEFEGWDRPDRDAFVIQLLPVLAKHSLVGCAIGIHMDAFAKAMAPHPELREMFGTPYAACFQWVVQTIISKMEECGADERIAFFHEANDYKGEALNAFDWIDKHRRKSRQSISFAFGSKADYVPLQAADTLAYETNHRLRDPAKEPRKSWVAMGAMKVHLQHYGTGNMGKLIATLTARRVALLASGWDGKVSLK